MEEGVLQYFVWAPYKAVQVECTFNFQGVSSVESTGAVEGKLAWYEDPVGFKG